MGVEEILMNQQIDLVSVVGDVNSTIAAALAAVAARPSDNTAAARDTRCFKGTIVLRSISTQLSRIFEKYFK